jgi:hypothetical protein
MQSDMMFLISYMPYTHFMAVLPIYQYHRDDLCLIISGYKLNMMSYGHSIILIETYDSIATSVLYMRILIC